MYNNICNYMQITHARWQMGGKQCARAGVIAEVRKREAYEKPSVKRKKKSEAARKRKYR